MIETLLYMSIVFNFIFYGIALINSNKKYSLRHYTQPTTLSTVSILVPLRNEEQNVLGLIESLKSINYNYLYFVLIDDCSDDSTLALLYQLTKGDNRFHIISGTTPPQGITGKSNACNILQEYEKKQIGSEIIIFTDADDRFDDEVVLKTLSAMESFEADVLSVFPQLVNETGAEKAFVPLVDIILYSYLPLPLVINSKFSSLSAANGQWLAFKRNLYDYIGGHQAVSNSKAEDISLARLTKQKGGRIVTLSGRGQIFTRMYNNLNEIIDGFTKNLYLIAGGNILSIMFFAVTLFITGILPIIALYANTYSSVALLSIFIMMLWKRAICRISAQTLIYSIFAHPITALFTIVLMFKSFFTNKFGKVTWKGRSI